MERAGYGNRSERIVDRTSPDENTIDRPRIERAVREILEAIGEDPDRDGLVRTPQRVAAMYDEVFSGLRDSPDRHLAVTFAADHDEMVMVRDIPLYSMCVPSRELINTTSGVKRAARIIAGDELWTFDTDGRLAKTTVVSAGWRRTSKVVRIRVNGRTICATPEHPVMTPSGWCETGALVVGDKVRVTDTRRLCRPAARWLRGTHWVT